jgi:peptide/nickel transport system ATP-binding protein
VAAGESFGLVGESGSGKSTLLRAIIGLAPVSGGQIALQGITLGKKRPREFYRRVQMVFQDPYGSLHPRHTIDRHLSEPLIINGFDHINQRVFHALDEVGLPASFRFRYPHQLSGGQRQRVAIAMALITEPEVLLLDEPTSALDVSIQAEVLNLLAAIRSQRRLTMVMVSHNLPVVAHLCERIGVMQHGQLVEELSDTDLHQRIAMHPYTRALLAASDGYRRGLLPQSPQLTWSET